MGINSHERFENHMDVSLPETSGDAEKITDFEEKQEPYDDLFDKKLDLSEKSGYDVDNEHLPDSMRLIKALDRYTAIDNKVIELPQQKLPSEIQNTFRGGNYRTVEAAEDLTLYRVYGEGAGKQGCYLTTQLPTDRMSVKIEAALPTKVEGVMTNNGFEESARWNNSREYYCEVDVPKGTIMNIGKVAEQYTADNHILKGGADQVLVSPQFAAEPKHYKNEQCLGFAGNYKEFSDKAKKLET